MRRIILKSKNILKLVNVDNLTGVELIEDNKKYFVVFELGADFIMVQEFNAIRPQLAVKRFAFQIEKEKEYYDLYSKIESDEDNWTVVVHIAEPERPSKDADIVIANVDDPNKLKVID